MKLTVKDKEFLETLSRLMADKDLWVELKDDGVKRLVLRGNYGDKIEKHFRMTRQGVRWRFQRLFNEVYVSAYEVIYLVETSFGTCLRDNALEISRERILRRRQVLQNSEKTADSRGYRR